MEILLDTSFILSCIRNKIDFFEELSSEGYEIIIPQEVINEINKFKEKKLEASTALKILKIKSFKEISLGKGHVDKKIINYLEKNPKIMIATLDKELSNKVQNKRMIIRSRKKLEIL